MKTQLEKIVMSTTQKLETGQNRYRVEANLNLYAVLKFDIVAENKTDAEHRAEKLLDEIEPTISVAIPEADFVEVDLPFDSIEPELLSVCKIE